MSKCTGAVTVEDLPIINSTLSDGKWVEIGIGTSGAVKIRSVEREIIKTGREKDRPKLKG